MTTSIYVENVLGSGQAVSVIEDFGDYSVNRELQPGESARLIVSPFKSIRMRESPLVCAGPQRSTPLCSLETSTPASPNAVAGETSAQLKRRL
jgi:hypothetical protein